MKRCFLLIMFISILVGQGACSSRSNISSTATRTTPPTLPQYPNRQLEELHSEKGITGFDVQIIRFQTLDSSVDVFAFYKDQLGKGGWTNFVQDKDFLSALNAEACPTFQLYIISKPIEARLTGIELRLVPTPCAVP
jgi:hypothetical protein